MSILVFLGCSRLRLLNFGSHLKDHSSGQFDQQVEFVFKINNGFDHSNEFVIQSLHLCLHMVQFCLHIVYLKDNFLLLLLTIQHGFGNSIFNIPIQ